MKIDLVKSNALGMLVAFVSIGRKNTSHQYRYCYGIGCERGKGK